MGKTLKNLSNKELNSNPVFPSRFVIEIAEKVHIHYRNLRILLSLPDFLEICRGFIQAYDRWVKQGSPEPKSGIHIELCRKKVATDASNEGLKINLNENLYNAHEGKIYAEGSEFKEQQYIHLKVRDLRIELSLNEFKELSESVKQADRELENSSIATSIQA